MPRRVEKFIGSLALWLLIFLSGCVALNEKSVEDKKVDESPAQDAATLEDESGGEKKLLKDLELKQARLWSRIDELESLVLKQQQRMKILEQALLIDHGSKEKRKEKTEAPKPAEKAVQAPRDSSIRASTRLPPTKASPQQIYAQKLESAKALFKEASWNKAFLAFSELDREADSSLSQGEPMYWLGRCWFQLNEFQSAKNLFLRFLELSPKHELAPSAQLFYAKTEMAMGRRAEGLSKFRELIKNYPSEKNAELAKQILKNINEEEL